MPELEPSRPPDRHCLLIDQGSSRVKWISAVWHAMSGNWNLDVTSFGEGEVADFEAAMESGEMIPPEEVLLTSVASDERIKALEGAIGSCTSAKILRLCSEAEACGIRNGYRKPQSLGSDRWMAILAGAVHHGVPMVVMDLGTASTLDAVDEAGKHLGGLILPGPMTMLNALAGSTAVSFKTEPDPQGIRRTSGEAQRETQAAIEGGVVTAQTGALGVFLDWFEQQLGEGKSAEIKTVVTGGAAGAILRQSVCQLTHDPLLVFRGMLLARFGPGEQ